MNDPTDPRKIVRIWHQSMTELDGLGIYRSFLESHARRVLGDDVAFDLHGLRSGTYHGRATTPALENAFVYHRMLDQVIDNAIVAERAGYDAFVIGSFSEPFLREIRSAVSMPVVSILESSMLIGCSYGRKIIPIANAPQIASMVRAAVDKHGLGERVIPAVSLDPPMHEPALATAFDEPGPVLAAFTATARAWIAAGADLVVPAEGVLATLVAANRVVHIDKAPVLDVFAVTWRHALMLIGLRECCGLEVSGVGHYARGEQALVDLMVRRD